MKRSKKGRTIAQSDTQENYHVELRRSNRRAKGDDDEEEEENENTNIELSTPNPKRASQASVTASYDSTVDGTSSSTKKRRSESSLSMLTHKFVHKVMNEKDAKVDMSNINEVLGVPRRRIYDIVNILEGASMARKDALNNTLSWVGPRVHCIDIDGEEELDSKGEEESLKADMSETEKLWKLRMELFKYESELTKLKSADKELDQCINHAQLAVRALLSESKPLAFISKDHIVSIPKFQDQTVLAIKAPAGTKLEVPSTDDIGSSNHTEKKYQIYLKSPGGALEVFLVDSSDQSKGFENKLGINLPHDQQESQTQQLVDSKDREFQGLDVGDSNGQLVSEDSNGTQKGMYKVITSDTKDMNTWINSQDHITSQDILDPTSLVISQEMLLTRSNTIDSQFASTAALSARLFGSDGKDIVDDEFGDDVDGVGMGGKPLNRSHSLV